MGILWIVFSLLVVVYVGESGEGVDESGVFVLVSLYVVMKVMVECIFEDVVIVGDFCVIVLCYFNLIGVDF